MYTIYIYTYDLYIDTLFANIFSTFVVYVFIFLVVTFEQKHLILKKSESVIFFFYGSYLRCHV